MRKLNYVFSIGSLVLGVLVVAFMLTQALEWSIGTAIGGVLILNGLVRIWFLQDDGS